MVVTDAGGSSTLGPSYTYVAPPTVTAIEPTQGPTAGGTSVTIKGKGFLTGSTVTIGAAATAVAVVSETEITAKTAANPAGAQEVIVSDVGGPSTGGPKYTYVAVPSVESITPTQGPTAGGTSVKIKGKGFVSPATVKIGSSATSVAVVSETEITATTAATAAGAQEVIVTDVGGSSTAGPKYTYLAPPSVESITPTQGPTAGGTSVKIKGKGFLTGSTVTIGSAATSVAVVSATEITAKTAANPAGPQEVIVTDVGGSSTAGPKYTYVAPPSVESITPTQGPTAGGTSVKIKGKGFLTGSTVTIGAAATAVAVVSETEITAKTAAGSAGPQEVIVTDVGGSSTAGPKYTYLAPPSVESITPTQGTETGGNSVTITGTSFTGATAVKFGANPAKSFEVKSATEIKAESPAGTGTVDVTVTTPGGESATGAADRFTYVAAVQQEPQGSWVGKLGSAGYLLANWNGAQDLSYLPNVTATLEQGSRYQWAANTTDVRALQSPDGSTRNAATYYDANEIKLKLGFSKAYSGNLHLYALDWDSAGRRETITVNDGSGPRSVALSSEFSNGAWVSIPINVPAAGTVSITVVRTAGPNAVLSGILLGDVGAPPTMPVSSAPKGAWVGEVGSAGYALADWSGVQDASYLPNASLSLVHGGRYQWAANTTDVRALQSPDGLSRNASTYYDSNQIQAKLTFTAAYSGSLHLYALDWETTARREIVSVNGQSAVLGEFNQGAWVSFPINVAAGGTVTITVDRTAGPNAVLSGLFLGEAGAPPGATVSSAPQGAWVGAVGSAGYDLTGWDGSAGDVSNLPNASLSLVQGSRWQWAAGSADARALSDPSGLTHNVGGYYDPNQIQAKLTFTAAYSGNLHLYALDWDTTARREIITVNGQSTALGELNKGAWVSFPINVAAGGTVTITVDRTAGPNAVLSGIFLGDAGAPPAMTVSSPPQGNWVGTYGKTEYDLLAFNGSSDETSLSKASVSIDQGSRFTWAASTAEERALENPGKTARVAATLYDFNQIRLHLSFTAAYSGNLELYALDWDASARREMISVNGQTAVLSSAFNNGAWVTFPISVPAGGTVTITVDRTAGPNAVLSGIFVN